MLELEQDSTTSSQWKGIQAGNTVLILGEPGVEQLGKIKELVGVEGQVIVVPNDRIHDLKTNTTKIDEWLHEHPVKASTDWFSLKKQIASFNESTPFVADASIDLVLCEINLYQVPITEKQEMLVEIYRVLRKGGKALLTDVVADEIIPKALREESDFPYPHAFKEDGWLLAVEQSGLYGVTIMDRESTATIVQGIEFKRVTLAGYKGREGECWDHKQAALYKGPFKRVEDDDGHIFERGKRLAICERTVGLLNREPYQGMFEVIEPYRTLHSDEIEMFPHGPAFERSPKETKKGLELPIFNEDSCGCGPGCC